MTHCDLTESDDFFTKPFTHRAKKACAQKSVASKSVHYNKHTINNSRAQLIVRSIIACAQKITS